MIAQNRYLQNKVNELQRENRQKTDSMETEDQPQDILSESDSDESDIDVGPELLDTITGIDKALDHILKMRKQFLEALERYDEIDNEYKKDIIKKYVKLKGKLWGEWYDVKEEEEGDGMDDGDGEEENDGNNDGDEEGEVDGEGNDQEEECEEDDKNNIMEFVLQLEYVADEDDKAYIERLWKKS